MLKIKYKEMCLVVTFTNLVASQGRALSFLYLLTHTNNLFNYFFLDDCTGGGSVNTSIYQKKHHPFQVISIRD